jgi:hypothetical protein
MRAIISLRRSACEARLRRGSNSDSRVEKGRSAAASWQGTLSNTRAARATYCRGSPASLHRLNVCAEAPDSPCPSARRGPGMQGGVNMPGLHSATGISTERQLPDSPGHARSTGHGDVGAADAPCPSKTCRHQLWPVPGGLLVGPSGIAESRRETSAPAPKSVYARFRQNA